MNVDEAVASIAAAIGEPARARILYSLLDGHARTATELAAIAEVTPSTASAHLHRLEAEQLIRVFKHGKHRYYSLAGEDVARALEALSIIAGRPNEFVPNTPSRLVLARSCYDHMAGKVAVLLNERFLAAGWLTPAENDAYELTAAGSRAFESLGVDIASATASRRRFAYACLDWSERQPHTGGALGAAMLQVALKKKWVAPDLDSRALRVTKAGRRELEGRLGVRIEG